MLLLVLADNYLVLYAGWEGVGLASYLLIGFWQHKPTAAAAAKKAFIVNRVGDAGLTLAIFLMFTKFGTMSFTGVFGQAARRPATCAHRDRAAAAARAPAASPRRCRCSPGSGRDGGPHPGVGADPRGDHGHRGVYLIVRSNPISPVPGRPARRHHRRRGHAAVRRRSSAAPRTTSRSALAGSTMSQIGYMMLAAGLGPGRLRVRDRCTCSRTASSRPACSSAPARSSTDERRAGHAPATAGCARVAADHLRRPSAWATWPSSASRRSPASSPRTPIIEAALASGGARGWVLGSCALIGAGITAFYMTRVMLHDLLRRASVGPRTPIRTRRPR